MKATVFLVGAVIIAGLTAYIVLEVLNAAEKKAEMASRIDKEMIVVAKNDLYVGLPITEADLTVVEMLPGSLPIELVYTDPKELIGQTPRDHILKDEVIRLERLARRDAGFGLNAIISPGKRAMTIETDAESNLSGFLQPRLVHLYTFI